MLSVCIPVYNTDVNSLVNELISQAQRLAITVEIILLDDGSSDEFRKINERDSSLVKSVFLEKNIGRARIRNLFLAYAKFEYLLFIDSDSIIISDNFLTNYINCIREGEVYVICGGRIYDAAAPSGKKKLRWKYGIKNESRSSGLRNFNPYKSFMTNNFLISRKIFEEIRFDERITEYGHEDTLFGFQLKKRGIGIKHIDNPVLNGGLEDNAEYLVKTGAGVINLIQILRFVNYDPGFIEDVTLLKTHMKLSSLRLIWLVKIIFRLTESLVKWLLLNGIVSIGLFSFYKLGLLVMNYSKGNNRE